MEKRDKNGKVWRSPADGSYNVPKGWNRLQGEGPNPSGKCVCGCGGGTPLAKRGNTKRGLVAGKPTRFIKGHENRARKRSAEARRKAAESLKAHWKAHPERHRAPSGKDHYNWKGGITSETQSLRDTGAYKKWRRLVFERDQFTCQWCGRVGGELQADHIYPWHQWVFLRFVLSNGRTRLVACAGGLLAKKRRA